MSSINRNSTVAVDCFNPLFDDVDYSNAEAVENARAAILRMAVWDGIAEWAFQRGHAEDAVAAIAQLNLCKQAAVWQRENPGQQAAAGLSEDHQSAAQASLLSLLSPHGARAMTSYFELLPQGIRYTPDTGYPEADALLEMAVRDTGLEYAGATWEAAGAHDEAAVAYDKLATDRWHAGKCEKAARAYERAAHNCESAHAFADAARVYGKAAIAWQFDRQFVHAARAYEMVAAASMAAGTPDDAAKAHTKAAGYWMIERDPAQAARVHEQAGAAWRACGMSRAASMAWKEAARCWLVAGEPERAKSARSAQAMALAEVVEVWEAAGRHDKAGLACRMQAKAWQAAGEPERAARAWRQALLATGQNKAAADEVRSSAAQLFRIEMDAEEFPEA